MGGQIPEVRGTNLSVDTLHSCAFEPVIKSLVSSVLLFCGWTLTFDLAFKKVTGENAFPYRDRRNIMLLIAGGCNLLKSGLPPLKFPFKTNVQCHSVTYILHHSLCICSQLSDCMTAVWECFFFFFFLNNCNITTQLTFQVPSASFHIQDIFTTFRLKRLGFT